jgi:hypothetical protein
MFKLEFFMIVFCTLCQNNIWFSKKIFEKKYAFQTWPEVFSVARGFPRDSSLIIIERILIIGGTGKNMIFFFFFYSISLKYLPEEEFIQW